MRRRSTVVANLERSRREYMKAKGDEHSKARHIICGLLHLIALAACVYLLFSLPFAKLGEAELGNAFEIAKGLIKKDLIIDEGMQGKLILVLAISALLCCLMLIEALENLFSKSTFLWRIPVLTIFVEIIFLASMAALIYFAGAKPLLSDYNCSVSFIPYAIVALYSLPTLTIDIPLALTRRI